MLASRVEWERVWVPKLSAPAVKPKQKSFTTAAAKEQAMSKIGKANPSLLAALKNI
jgi:hypothetical protein